MTKLNPKQKAKKHFFNLKVRIIEGPLVDSEVLNDILARRQRAVVL